MPRRQVLVALVVALVASALTYVYISRPGEAEEVVVAAGEILQGAPITAKAVRLSRVPRAFVHESAFRRMDDVVGKYASQRIVAGEQVLKDRVAPDRHAWPTAGLAGDLRAVFVPVPASRAVGGAVGSGERIDVIFVSQAERPGAAVARRILRSVPVIATAFAEDDSRGFSYGAASRGPAGSGEGVMLAVTPADAERLAFCLENGQVYLAAVPYGADPVRTPGVTWNGLFQEEGSAEAQAPGQ